MKTHYGITIAENGYIFTDREYDEDTGKFDEIHSVFEKLEDLIEHLIYTCEPGSRYDTHRLAAVRLPGDKVDTPPSIDTYDWRLRDFLDLFKDQGSK